jgi:hypothetical protein
MHELVKFFRANPQVLVLLLICLVLGLGTFLAVIFGLISSKSGTTSGEPAGVVLAWHGPAIGGHMAAAPHPVAVALALG